MSRLTIEVNGVTITHEAIREEAAELRREAREAGQEVSFEDGPRFLEQAEQALVERILLDQETARLKIAVSDDQIDAVMARVNPRSDGVAGCREANDDPPTRADVERRMRIDVLLQRWTAAVPAPSTKKIREAYTVHRERFWIPESILVSHIVKNIEHEDQRQRAEQQMAEVHRALMDGADFAATADAHSDCAGSGGTLGYISRGQMVPEFEDVVFQAPLKQVTAVFPTRFGLHIALVTERRGEGIRSFAEVSDQIRDALWGAARDREIGKQFDELRGRAAIRRIA